MPKLQQKMPYLGIFGLELKKTIVIFDISTLKFVQNESLTHVQLTPDKWNLQETEDYGST